MMVSIVSFQRIILSTLCLLLWNPEITQAETSCTSFFPGGAAPKTTKPYKLLCNEGFAVGFSEELKEPLWSAEHLTKDTIIQARQLHGRAPFHDDRRVPYKYSAHKEDYRMSIWSRGHMTPSGDMPTRASRFQTFAFSNIVPQSQVLNTRKWEHLEERVRNQAVRYGEVYVITGPVFDEDMGDTGPDHIRVPSSTWKAVYIPKIKEGYIEICHNDNKPQCTQITAKELEEVSGVTLKTSTD